MEASLDLRAPRKKNSFKYTRLQARRIRLDETLLIIWKILIVFYDGTGGNGDIPIIPSIHVKLIRSPLYCKTVIIQAQTMIVPYINLCKLITTNSK